MQHPLLDISPPRPPGFEAPPAPPLGATLTCSDQRQPAEVDHGLSEELVGLTIPPLGDAVAPLFSMRQPALLPLVEPAPSPPSPRPCRPTTRRKTMACMRISNKGVISLQKVRGPARSRAVPVALAVERLVCRSLSITKNGRDVTASTLDAFEERFKQQLPLEVIVAMRGFFKLDDASVNEVEDALIEHGGLGIARGGLLISFALCLGLSGPMLAHLLCKGVPYLPMAGFLPCIRSCLFPGPADHVFVSVNSRALLVCQ
ncbi:hypothetical protein ZWY2020_020489 [Hordeum vulgare]|nr:hypothetical protein ZWY2020_020489 [Hordeum vulgare]